MSILLGNCNSDINGNYVKCKNKKNILSKLGKTLNKIGLNTLNIDIDVDEIIWMRDIYFIIDNQCFLCNLTECDSMKINRSKQGKDLINILSKKYTINYIPEEIDIEGGDLLQSDNDIFVGIGDRTNYSIIDFLYTKFPKKNIIPIKHTSLHLDCVFTILNDNKILYHSDYVSPFKINNYEILDIKEFVNPANPIPCNFLLYNDNIVCSDLIKNEMLLELLKILNYRVYTINIDNLWKEGGGIRCLTQWYTTLRSQYIY